MPIIAREGADESNPSKYVVTMSLWHNTPLPSASGNLI
jgi:hypothetical protein